MNGAVGDDDWRTQRREALNGERSPDFPAGVTDHLRHRWDAVRALAADRIDDAINHLDEAELTAPELTGYLDGYEFDGWRDTDDLLGPTLEVIISNRYGWAPFEMIASLHLGAPEDSYWPIELQLTDGRRLSGLMPGCYLGSETDERPEIRSGEATDWYTPIEDGPIRGLGGRVWLFGEAEIHIGECQQIKLVHGRINLA